MKDVQGWWEVPSICYYCSLLGNAFGLPDFTIEVMFFIEELNYSSYTYGTAYTRIES
jgi:hypothetical protein